MNGSHNYARHDSSISPSALTPEALRYRQEQLRIASQAADLNPELTGSRPAFTISTDQKEKLMTALIPLLFFDGRVYFATVGQISAVRERDRSVILAHRINLKTKSNEPPVLCLPSNITFSQFVQDYAPNFAVVYGDPLALSDSEMRKRGISSSDKNSGGVGSLKFSKVAINPDRVVGIYPEENWCTVVEVAGPSYEAKNTSNGFFAKSDNSGGSNTLASCTITTNLKISSAIGDVLRKLRPDSYENICLIIGNRDIGFGKRI